MKENIYVCEECCHKADRVKICCGKKMIPIEKATKESKNMCGCS